MTNEVTNEDVVVQRLGRRVAAFRRQADMKQEALADALHPHQQTVSDIEKGKREIKPNELGRIARALGVTTVDLIGGLGYTGEPISVTGAGKVGTKGGGKRG